METRAEAERRLRREYRGKDSRFKANMTEAEFIAWHLDVEMLDEDHKVRGYF